MNSFLKSALPIHDQIKKLQSRGLIISDTQKISHYLSNISYYRLSAYFHIFLEEPKDQHKFKPGTTFDDVLDVYVFDRKLRVLLFDEIERLEIAFRTQLVLHCSLEFGNNWYENSKLFYNLDDYDKTLAIILDNILHSKEIFIKHYKSTYHSPPNPPAWMTIELISLTQLSILYKNLKISEGSAKKNIAKHFGVSPQILESWMETLSFIRNTCAHHSRLWNRGIPKGPKTPSNPQYLWTQHQFITTLSSGKIDNQAKKLYIVLCIVQYLIKIINPDTHFAKNLKRLLLEEHPNISLEAMGIPPGWDKEEFWN